MDHAQSTDVDPPVGRLHVLLLAVAGACYARALGCGFVNLDDPVLVLDNPLVRQGFSWAAVRQSFGTDAAVGWNPLAWMSHILDWQLFGAAPAGHHGVNVLLHLANVSLLFELLRRMTGAAVRSAAVAGLLALHPLHVESVAWVAERRDVLCMFWMLVTLHAYRVYAANSTLGRYTLVLVCFLLALMSKPLAVTLPCAMLLLDHWPLGRLAGRWRRCVVEKLPTLGLSAMASWLTILTHRKLDAVASLEHLDIAFRVQNALVSYATYLVKLVRPNDLAVPYPIPPSYPVWQVAVSAGLLAAITAVAVVRRRNAPYGLVGWLWFLGTMVPMSGVLQVGGQAMADRFAYLPMIGIYVALVWTVADVAASRQVRRRTLTIAAGLVFAVLWLLSFVQIGYWTHTISLFDHAVHVTQGNTHAMNTLGVELMRRNAPGDLDRAVVLLEQALRADPQDSFVLRSLGDALVAQGRRAEAAAHYAKLARQFVGLAQQDRNPQMLALAVKYYQRSLACSPAQTDVRAELNRLLQVTGLQGNEHE